MARRGERRGARRVGQQGPVGRESGGALNGCGSPAPTRNRLESCGSISAARRRASCVLPAEGCVARWYRPSTAASGTARLLPSSAPSFGRTEDGSMSPQARRQHPKLAKARSFSGEAPSLSGRGRSMEASLLRNGQHLTLVGSCC